MGNLRRKKTIIFRLKSGADRGGEEVRTIS